MKRDLSVCAFVVDTVSDSHGNAGLHDPDSCVLRMSHSSWAGSALPVGESLIPVQTLLGGSALSLSPFLSHLSDGVSPLLDVEPC